MGDHIIFVPRAKRAPKTRFDDDISKILTEVVETTKQTFGREEDGVFQMYGSFENLLRAKIGMILLKERPLNFELFRCSLYVSEMLEGFLSKKPESYDGIDYLLSGNNECNPDDFKKGGDLCFVLCTFFEGWCDRIRRPLKLSNYLNRGAQLYFNFHSETKNEIGYCMGENFRAIVSLTKRSIRTL